MRPSFLPIFFFLIFSATAIILSYWAGSFFWNSIVIGAVSLGISAILFNRFKSEFDVKIPPLVLLFSAVVLILSLWPALFVTPGYLGSMDSMTITHDRIITGHVPSTYEPYSPLKVYYFLGFTFVGKLFTDALFFLPDYLVIIFLGAFAAALHPILLFFIGKELGKSETAGILSALLFVGTKMVFQNMYYGLFPWLLSTAFFLLIVFAVLKKSKIAFLLVPAMILSHIAPLMYSMLLLPIYLFFFGLKADKKNILYLVAAILLAAPIFTTYYAFVTDGISINAGEVLVSA